MQLVCDMLSTFSAYKMNGKVNKSHSHIYQNETMHRIEQWPMENIAITLQLPLMLRRNQCTIYARKHFFSSIFICEVKNNEIKCVKPSSATNAAALPGLHFNILFVRTEFFFCVCFLSVLSRQFMFMFMSLVKNSYFHIPRTHKSTPKTNAHCFE